MRAEEPNTLERSTVLWIDQEFFGPMENAILEWNLKSLAIDLDQSLRPLAVLGLLGFEVIRHYLLQLIR